MARWRGSLPRGVPVAMALRWPLLSLGARSVSVGVSALFPVGHTSGATVSPAVPLKP